MNKLAAALLSTLVLLAACGKQESAAPARRRPLRRLAAEQPAAPRPDAEGSGSAADQAAADQAATAPAETVSEMDDAPPATEQPQAASTTQPATEAGRLGGRSADLLESSRKARTTRRSCRRSPPMRAPGKVEVTEVFWYGCGHCFALDPAIESWTAKSKPPYIEFDRVPAMWNEGTRLHARIFYTAEVLGKLEELHTLIFREIHVNGNQLNTVDKIAAFFQQHGVSKEKFTETFSSFAVESSCSAPTSSTSAIASSPCRPSSSTASTAPTSARPAASHSCSSLIDELAAHEHGG